jgi:hypothetical protein
MKIFLKSFALLQTTNFLQNYKSLNVQLVTHSQMTITIHHYGRNTTIHTLIRQQLHGIVRIHNTKIKFNQEEGLK